MSKDNSKDDKRPEDPELIPTVSSDESMGESGGQIGPYKLLSTLGEGGMGIVYLAQQQHPIKRRVALKVIKPGMDTKQVLARFEAERQALAMLDHPNIAHVYEAGATEAGRPYFVMEHVEGVPITEHCDRHKLDIEDRLKLFRQACEAIQHAHQKGIIHRDIKPPNILVMIDQDKEILKVIDFGVAKATSQTLTERTLFTEQGQLIGTPEYMSPEQAEMTAQDIDTRSDIYSLGVVLYELLTGALPFDPAILRQAAFAEIQRIIREQDPPRPSTRLSSLGADATKIAQSRRTEVASLTKRLHKELEWIPLKAMRKERTMRYRSASELADDIGNYLDGSPLIAGPESMRYRARKFVRRNRALVTGVAAVLIVLVAGIVTSTIFAIGQARARIEVDKARKAEVEERQIALAERDRAVEAERLAEQSRVGAVGARDEAEQARVRAENAEKIAQQQRESAEKARKEEAVARKEAERQAKIAKAVNVFLNEDLLASITPENAQGKEVSVREVLENASEKIEGKFKGEPLIEASIRKTLGWTYYSLGKFETAEPHLKRARNIYREQLGEEHPDTLGSMNELAILYNSQGRYEEAKSLYVKTLEIRRRVLGEEHPSTLASMNNLALLYKKQGRHEEAESLNHKALEIKRRVLGEEHPSTLTSMNNLAGLYKDQGRYEEAEPLYVKTLEIRRRVLGEEHPGTLISMNNLALLYNNQGRYEEAESLNLKALEVGRRVLGEKHPGTLISMNNLALLYNNQGRYEEAEPLYVNTLEITRQVLGEEHPGTLVSMNNLALLYNNKGRYEEAEPLYFKTLEVKRQVLGEEHPDTLVSMNNLALLYNNQGRYEEAELLNLKALEVGRRVLGEKHPGTLISMNNLALLYNNQGRYEEAEPLYVKTLEIRRRVLGEEHPETLSTMNSLAWLWATCPQAEVRDGAQAVEHATRACELTDWKNTGYINTLAAAYAEAGDFETAVKWQQKAIDLLTEEEAAKWRDEDEERLKLYQSGQPYHQKPRD